MVKEYFDFEVLFIERDIYKIYTMQLKLGLILTLVACFHTIRRDTKIMFRVNRSLVGINRYIPDEACLCR
jgi:hypothetical protein